MTKHYCIPARSQMSGLRPQRKVRMHFRCYVVPGGVQYWQSMLEEMFHAGHHQLTVDIVDVQ